MSLLASKTFGIIRSRATNINGPSNRLISTTCVLNAQAKQSPKIDVNLPSRPKKPVTPWIMFVRERKDELFRQRGKMTAPELSILLSREWKDADRARYESDYVRLHDKYLEEIERYRASLTEEQRDYLSSLKDVKRESKAMKELRSKTNIPKSPRNASNFFVEKRCKDLDMKELLKTNKASDVFSMLFKEYRSLDEDEKRKYVIMQEEDRERFNQECVAWHANIKNIPDLSSAARELVEKLRLTKLNPIKYL